MKILIIIPKYEKEVHSLVLELANYFGIWNVQYRVSDKYGKYVILVNGSVFAKARSLEGLRARFWRNWRLLKKYGYIPSRNR